MYRHTYHALLKLLLKSNWCGFLFYFYIMVQHKCQFSVSETVLGMLLVVVGVTLCVIDKVWLNIPADLARLDFTKFHIFCKQTTWWTCIQRDEHGYMYEHCLPSPDKLLHHDSLCMKSKALWRAWLVIGGYLSVVSSSPIKDPRCFIEQ